MNERMTDRARKVFDLSLREALQLGHHYIGTEHLLLGLIREGEGVAAQVLVTDLGIDLALARRAVVDRLSSYYTDSPPALLACPLCAKHIDRHSAGERRDCLREIRRRQLGTL